MVYLGELSDNVCLECGASPPLHQPDCKIVLIRVLTGMRDMALKGVEPGEKITDQWALARLRTIAADLSRLVILMEPEASGAPDTIYLRVDPTWTEEDGYRQFEGVTWSLERVNASDVLYVRATDPAELAKTLPSKEAREG